MPRFRIHFVPVISLVFCSVILACTTNPEMKRAGSMTPAPGDAALLPSELSVAHPALYRAWQGTDPMAMRAYYTDNALIVTSTDRYSGWNDISTRWLTPRLKNMSAFMAMPQSFTREGDEIVETGRFTFTTTVDGKAQNVKGAYAQRWQRQANGMWRIVSANVVTEENPR